jgi:hypothetical protein
MDFPGNALTNFYVLVSICRWLSVPRLTYVVSRMTSRILHMLFALRRIWQTMARRGVRLQTLCGYKVHLQLDSEKWNMKSENSVFLFRLTL